ncbi:MAG: hypothetical protein M3R06_11990 [Chloroflexota bacterium]|nr:hypothetical protein [Chloroflexota bacterium]
MSQRSPTSAARFSIGWTLTDEEWLKAREYRDEHPPGSTYDRHRDALIQLLWGSVQFSYGETLLYPVERKREVLARGYTEHDAAGHGAYLMVASDEELAQGMTHGLVDLSLYLADLLAGPNFKSAADGSIALFDAKGYCGCIRVTREGDDVLIDDAFGWATVRVPLAAFTAGVRDFLVRFTAEIETQAPDLLEWRSFIRLWPYRAQDWRAERARWGPTPLKGASRHPAAFAVRWTLDAAAWADARGFRQACPPGTEDDNAQTLRDQVLWGSIQINYGDALLYPGEPLFEFLTVPEESMCFMLWPTGWKEGLVVRRAWETAPLVAGAPPIPSSVQAAAARGAIHGVLDLAWHFAELLDVRRFATAPPLAVGVFEPNYDSPAIYSLRHGEWVEIQSGFAWATLKVPLDAYLTGVRDFLHRFTAEIERRSAGSPY